MSQASEVQHQETKPQQSTSPPDSPAAQVMCWKDPYKTCQCEQPTRGVFCGRFPMPTD